MYKEQINEYIQKTPVFFSKELQNKLNTEDDKKKSILNTELARMEDKGSIIRLAKGLYVVPVKSCFGTSLPNKRLIAEKVYIDGNNGYVTGATFLNQIGLSSWMPKEIYIKSNYKGKINGLDEYVIKGANIPINADNLRYLQFIDCIEDMEKYEIDNKAPYDLLYHYAVSENLDFAKLLYTSHKHYKKQTTEKIFKIIEKSHETVTSDIKKKTDKEGRHKRI